MLLTSSLVLPDKIFFACDAVSGRVWRNASRVEADGIGWKIAAGRSCSVKTGERML